MIRTPDACRLFRPLERSDVPYLLRISRDNMAHILRSARGTEWRDDVLVETICHPDAVTEVLEVGGRVAGYFCVFGREESIFIASLQLASAFQQQGFGEKMMRRIEELARRSGLERAELWVQNNNEDAIGFYQHLGFCIVARQRNNFLMKKEFGCSLQCGGGNGGTPS